MFIIALLLTVIFCIVRPNPAVFCIVFFQVGLYMIFSYHSFFPIDEEAHFTYVEYLIEHCRAPKFTDSISASALNQIFPGNADMSSYYEAVQPPLYYFLCALITGFMKSIKARFYICRVLDLFFCISAIFTVYRSFGYLISRKIIKDSAYLDYIFYIAAFSQEFFIRSFVVTNDSLMYLLTALCFFFLLKIICEDKGYLLLTITLLLLLWTKISAGYFVGIMIAVLFVKKKFKKMCLMTGISIAGIMPWLIYNKMNYGDFTGSSSHISLVENVINPDGTAYSVMDCLQRLPGCIRDIFGNSSASLVLGGAAGLVFSFLAVLFLLSELFSIVFIFVRIVRLRSVFKFSLNEIILGMSAFSSLLAYSVISYVAAATDLYIIASRVMLCCIFPAQFIFCGKPSGLLPGSCRIIVPES